MMRSSSRFRSWQLQRYKFSTRLLQQGLGLSKSSKKRLGFGLRLYLFRKLYLVRLRC